LGNATPDKPFDSSPSSFQILLVARLDEEAVAALLEVYVRGCPSYLSIESSTEDGDVDAGEWLGDCTISCKNDGRRGAGVYVFWFIVDPTADPGKGEEDCRGPDVW
jgi:hypothetical protein